MIRLALLTLVAALAVPFQERPASSDPTSVVPVPRTDTAGAERQAEALRRVRTTESAHVVFLGASIMQGWEREGASVWKERIAPFGALQLGVGGDRTEHVLWRLENGNFDGLKPKAIVLMIGTNNTGHQKPDGYQCPAQQTADGVKAILEKLKAKCPNAKVLLLGIFPRGADANDKFRQQNEETNALIKANADEKTVFYMDIGGKFLQPDGTLSVEIMPDRLHLSPKGYEIWAEAIEGKVKGLLK